MSVARSPARAGQLGEVIAGRFRLEAELGEGGMAQVFRARDVRTGRGLAVKVLKPTDAQDEAEARLRREADVLRTLDVPAVVRIESFGKTKDGRIYIAMELLEGETLGARIRRQQRLDPADLVPVVAGVAAGLGAAHARGIVHRDLKPDNVFLARTDGSHAVQIKLLDFGISKVYGVEERLTATGQILGTPRYMAPEQLSADRDLDLRVDIYAFGVILYEALAGSPPFVAATPSDLIVAILHGKTTPLRTLRPELSPELAAVVQRAMAKAKEARYSTAHELADAFLSVAQVERSAPSARGKATHLMAGPGQSLGEVRDAASSGEQIRPGTFSALAEQHRDAPAPAPRSAGTLPSVSLKPRPAPGPSAATSPAPAAPVADATGPSESVHLPMRGRRVWPIVLALVAGALSAAAVIGVLHLTDDGEAEPEAPAASQNTVERPPTPVVEESMAALPVGDEPPEDPAPEEEPEEVSDGETEEAAMQPRRRRRRAREDREPSGGGDAPPPPFVEGDSPLTRARAALGRGDARTCIQILGDANLRSAAALRLEGDCFLRDGRTTDAVKSYEEFCARFSSHRAFEQVRQLVEQYGGRCVAR